MSAIRKMLTGPNKPEGSSLSGGNAASPISLFDHILITSIFKRLFFFDATFDMSTRQGFVQTIPITQKNSITSLFGLYVKRDKRNGVRGVKKVEFFLNSCKIEEYKYEAKSQTQNFKSPFYVATHTLFSNVELFSYFFVGKPFFSAELEYDTHFWG